MTGRRATAAWGAAILLGIAAMYFLWPRAPRPAAIGPIARAPRNIPGDQASAKSPELPPPRVAVGSGDGPSHIADELNAPGGTIRHDLEILNELFVAWQSNFPQTGNPVGENAEITAALAGDNALHFVFIPRDHRAIDANGELRDRWGTPFRFHQLSGAHMEIQSAGPDRKFATADDVRWPAAARPVP
jgi:hypothetical protein